MADAHLDHHFFQITTPRLGARPSLGSLAHLEGDRLTEASLKLLFTSMLTADGKETDYVGWYVGRRARTALFPFVDLSVDPESNPTRPQADESSTPL